MVTDAKQITEIAKKVMEQNYDFDHIGLRVQESDHGTSAGEEIEHLSRHWIDGDMTDDEIDGICAIDARSAAKRVLKFGAYMGNVVLVLGSNRRAYGEDDGEIIMHNPIVLDIIQS